MKEDNLMKNLEKHIKKDVLQKLVTAAIIASDNSFHPSKNGSVSKRSVGAAVLTTENEIFQGCNVQTTISGLGVCAEQCAIYHAVSQGKYNFTAVAVYFPTEQFIKPCGMCLQLITEFSQVINKDIIIVMINIKKQLKYTTVRKELKDGYGPLVSGRDVSQYIKNKKNQRTKYE
jgi:cytidine deaminase